MTTRSPTLMSSETTHMNGSLALLKLDDSIWSMRIRMKVPDGISEPRVAGLTGVVACGIASAATGAKARKAAMIAVRVFMAACLEALYGGTLCAEVLRRAVLARLWT